MSWIDKILHRPPKKRIFAPSMNGFTPIFSQYGTDIYASDVVQQAINCIVDEMKKLTPTHIRMKGGDPVPILNSTVASVLTNPNPLMTTSEFIEKITWLLMLNYNAFILPTYRSWIDPATGNERRYYEALYPLKPTQVDFIEDASGRLYCHLFFANQYDTTVPYDSLIHLRKNFSVNEYMGGDEMGQPNQEYLKDTIKLNNDLLKGVAKAMNASYAVNGVVKYNTMLDDGKTEAALLELERKLQNNESGFLPLDIKADFTPLEHTSTLVDEATLKFIDEKILRTWGVPLAILTGDFTKIQYAAFYQKTLEPLIIMYGQAFTKKVFTKRELGWGNKVEFYPSELVFMSVNQVLHMVQLLSNTGALFENEKRAAFGLRPLPELAGKRYMSLNFVDANIANAYQLGAMGNEDAEETGEQKFDEAIEVDGGIDDGGKFSEIEKEPEVE